MSEFLLAPVVIAAAQGGVGCGPGVVVVCDQ